MNDKEKYLDDLLQRLKNGESEEEIYKDLLNRYPTLGKKDKNSEDNSNYTDMNPLMIFAQENGAIRALIHNITRDINEDDEVSKRILTDEMNRLSNILLHYKKKEMILFPFLKKLNVETLDEVKSKDDIVLLTLNNININIKKNGIKFYYEDIKKLLNLIEENISYENKFLLPILDEHLSDSELSEIESYSDKLGYAFIRYKNQ